jgi:hypothetical protein
MVRSTIEERRRGPASSGASNEETDRGAQKAERIANDHVL